LVQYLSILFDQLFQLKNYQVLYNKDKKRDAPQDGKDQNTCISPIYILVENELKKKLIEKFKMYMNNQVSL
jgi:hypothetical protein